MTVQITVNPGLRRGVALVAFATAFALLLSALVLLLRKEALPVAPAPASLPALLPSTHPDTDTFLPVLSVCVREGAHEAAWIEAAASSLSGQPEVSVGSGRMDIRTRLYAIEIDFLDKWHEGIGQSLHYAAESGLRPALGLVLEGEDRLGSPQSRAKLDMADQVALKQGIRVFVLSSSCAGGD